MQDYNLGTDPIQVKKSQCGPLNWHVSHGRESLLACIFSSLYFLSYQHCGVNLWDEGVLLSGAQRILDGDVPIRDFLSYPPARYLISAAGLLLSDGNVDGPRFLISLLSGIMGGLVFFLARTVSGRVPALITLAIFLSAPSPYYYRFFTLSLLSVMLASFLMLEHVDIRTGIIAGCISGLTIWFRVEVGVFAVVFFLGVLIPARISDIRSRSANIQAAVRLLLLLLSPAIPWLVLIHYLGGCGIVREYFLEYSRIAIAGQPGMGLEWPQIWNADYWIQNGFWKGFQSTLILMSFPTLIFCWIKNLRAGDRVRGTAQAYYAIACFSLGLVIWRAGYGNFLRVVPIIAIPCVSTMFRSSFATGMAFRLLNYLVVSILAGLFMVDALIIHPVQYCSIGRMKRETYRVEIDRLSVATDFHTGGVVEKTVEIADRILPTEGALVCFPFNPIWNFLLRRPNPLRNEWLLPGQMEHNRTEQILGILKQTTIAGFIINDLPLDNVPVRKFSQAYPDLFHWIDRHFFQIGMVENFMIFSYPSHQEHLLPDLIPESVDGMVEFDTVDIAGSSWSSYRLDGTGQICFAVMTRGPFVFKMGVLEHDFQPVTLRILWETETDQNVILTRQLPETSNLSSEICVVPAMKSENGLLCISVESTSDARTWLVDPVVGYWDQYPGSLGFD